MSRPLAPKGGDDDVRTPPELALAIVEHFRPHGRRLEPCRGAWDGAFFQAMGGCDWCEIKEGRDFMDDQGLRIAPNCGVLNRWDWVVTNPPWSKFREFLIQSMRVADNIVFLCLTNAWFMKARRRDIRAYGFGLVEILELDTPPKPWPQTGFQLGAGWLRRGWQGGTTWSKLK